MPYRSLEMLPRSLLFVPGDQRDKIEKAWKAGPDCVILDLEDGVAQAQKPAARQHVASALPRLTLHSSPILVRINSDLPEQSHDLEAAVQPGMFGIVLPKCNHRDQIAEFAVALSEVEKRKGISVGSLKLFLLIESARGLLELDSMAGISERVAALVFGAEDWCLDMGIARTRGGAELEIARWHIVLCARAHRLLAIDTVYADFRDSEGLRADAGTTRRMGFSGKLAIHPNQIEVIHSAWTPSDAEVADAERTVAAFDDAISRGLGAISANGKMIDKPIAERARQILLWAKKPK